MSGKTMFITFLLFFTMVLGGCASPWAANPVAIPATESLGFLLESPSSTEQPAAPVVPSNTPDPCAVENLSGEIKKINNPVLQFEQIVFIARFTPSAELIRPILELQDILWQAQVQEAPVCLVNLKQRRDEYLGSVISYLVHFMGGIKTEVLDTEMQASAGLRQAYEVELALVTGVNTPTPIPTMTAQTSETPAATPGTPTAQKSPRPSASPTVPASTKAAPSATPTAAPSNTPESIGSIETKTIPVTGGQADEIIMTNTTTHNLFLHATPSLTSQTVYVLNSGDQLSIIGRTEDGIWLLAEYEPGKTGWIYSNTYATFSIPVPNMPVVTPQP